MRRIAKEPILEDQLKSMGVQMWHPDFKPEEDSLMAPIWVLLPKLPFHCHTWHYVKQILSPIGIPLIMDNATTNRTRPSMAKVRVEVDLTKPRIDKIWVGLEDESYPLKGFYQKVEYESVPKFCTHCKKLGHSLVQCRFAKKKNDDNKNEMIQEGVDQAVTSENNDSEEKEKVEKKNDTKQVEEKAVEIHANKTKGEKQREKRKQRRRRNALKVVRNKGQEGIKNKEKKQLKNGEKEKQNQVNNDNIDHDTNQLLNKDTVSANEVENQERDVNQEKNSLGEDNNISEEHQEIPKENQIHKTGVVITTNDKEESSNKDLSVPHQSPLKTHNVFESIADDTGQFEEEEEQG
ncbi:uncharacterized protein LOC132624193 [Lycium barbarum]|uniref:uncharacterized protein LOC132624193 n=1 Tax=Lycium barbarum TaxID=112863 RepID=UPI00293F064B|nr:uncharacterized protein LOC132624193 [Lycium barbarum]